MGNKVAKYLWKIKIAFKKNWWIGSSNYYFWKIKRKKLSCSVLDVSNKNDFIVEYWFKEESLSL